jgi:hypothetical protein
MVSSLISRSNDLMIHGVFQEANPTLLQEANLNINVWEYGGKKIAWVLCVIFRSQASFPEILNIEIRGFQFASGTPSDTASDTPSCTKTVGELALSYRRPVMGKSETWVFLVLVASSY